MFLFFRMYCYIVSQSLHYATDHKAKDLHHLVVTKKKTQSFVDLTALKVIKSFFIFNPTCNLKTVISMFQSTSEMGELRGRAQHPLGGI